MTHFKDFSGRPISFRARDGIMKSVVKDSCDLDTHSDKGQRFGFYIEILTYLRSAAK